MIKRKKLSLSTTQIIILSFLAVILLGTFIVEGVGALLYMTVFVPRFGTRGIWISVFNAISAFCNAGIDIIADIDTVIICMASNLEASVMAVTLCKEAGVKNVIAKCSNEMHQKILLRVGADKVVFPEQESGVRLAKNLLSSGFIDMVSLAKNISVVEISVKDEWIGKSLIDLNLRKKHDLNIIAIRTGDEINISINPNEPLKKDMTLIVIADISKLSKLK